jgi:hypothetical protein
LRSLRKTFRWRPIHFTLLANSSFRQGRDGQQVRHSRPSARDHLATADFAWFACIASFADNDEDCGVTVSSICEQAHCQPEATRESCIWHDIHRLPGATACREYPSRGERARA